jgi:ankyrin repeat protein
MQMNQCTPQIALAFVAQVHSVINVPLTPSGQTLLMLAASISSVNLAKAVISYKPNFQIRDSIGRTALHYAASVGSIEIFELLVKYGCSAHEQTIGG